MGASFVCEPLLTGLGAGGYMLVVAPGAEPVLLDFFVEAPGREPAPAPRAELLPISVSFGDAVQIFNVGPASVGTHGLPAGLAAASARFGTVPLADLLAPAARLAREGIRLTPRQAYLFEILGGIVLSTPECAALFAPGGVLPSVGELVRQPELADTLERLGREGPDPFYTGDIGRAIVEWVGGRGGTVTAADLSAYAVVDRPPVRTRFRGHDVVTNPPPSAGGILIAVALELLSEGDGPIALEDVVRAMEQVQLARTPAFMDGLDQEGFEDRFLADARAGRLGSTTHIAVLDADGWACSVTCSNGACSGVVVPGTGIHLNNMLGEQDLNPLGFHRHAPGRRLPSMMAPTVALRGGRAELALGSAGSNRIRSAILQTILRVLGEGMAAGEAVKAPRVHFEDGIVYAEPGIDTAALERAGRTVARFRERNLFFGGVQAVRREQDGTFSGGGDPRRGGDAVVVPG